MRHAWKCGQEAWWSYSYGLLGGRVVVKACCGLGRHEGSLVNETLDKRTEDLGLEGLV